ncbi:MAG TPA: Gfo/Idh/MocA family oxidoreductase [Lacipirellulaceae bacterium]|nr:Gfo/Idh/MocA family oxidoreductase [Lacipirellulaceae bacterium]
MIRVGLVGIGFMGWIHWLAYERLTGARVAAICTRNEQRLSGDWRGIQGNFGPFAGQVDLVNVSAYAKIDDLLNDPQIDLVDLTLPPSEHANVAIRALEAGKHVFCEKPMALRLGDCDRMLTAARSANRLLLIGHVLPFFPEYAWALDAVRSGKYGRPRGGAFRRVIADPTWLKNYWSLDRAGGPMLDLHVHDAHFIRLLFGMPSEVVTCGRLRRRVSPRLEPRVSERRDDVEDLPEFWHSQFRFADRDLTVEATSGTINQQGRSFTHGFEIHLEDATLVSEFAVIGGAERHLCEPMLLDADGKVQHPQLSSADPVDAFVDQLREVTCCVRDGCPSEILGAVLAQDAIRLCEAQAESLKVGKAISISAK